jgi:hypothetical protein
MRREAIAVSCSLRRRVRTACWGVVTRATRENRDPCAARRSPLASWLLKRPEIDKGDPQ